MPPRQNHGLPARPSFPQQPQTYQPTGHAPSPPINQGNLAVNALTSALANPYAQYQSPHYAQAYAQYYNAAQYGQVATPQGYTYSSTFNPNAPSTSSCPSTSYGGSASHGAPQNQRGRGTGRGGAQTSARNAQQPRQQPAPWYSPGDSRCAQQGCAFMGSAKAVEIHMMDRHLIYPPGWDKRKKQSDWDADPSLKGKPILIQGTGIKLDTPEAIEGWIAERKRRWPTSERVEEKKRKLEEAIARGQIHPDDPSLRGRKRRKVDGEGDGSRGTTREDGGWRGGARGRGRGGGRGRGQNRPAASAARAQGSPERAQSTGTKPSEEAHDASSSASSSDSDEDGAPEVVSSKANVEPECPPEREEAPDAPVDPSDAQDVVSRHVTDYSSDHAELEPAQQAQVPEPIRKPLPQRPKGPPRNAFGPRSSLLRNLLLPEIRMTVSNLSQAIHFLVDNDFLENVEMKPGEADEKMIEVVGETAHDTSTGGDSDSGKFATNLVEPATPAIPKDEPSQNIPSLN